MSDIGSGRSLGKGFGIMRELPQVLLPRGISVSQISRISHNTITRNTKHKPIALLNESFLPQQYKYNAGDSDDSWGGCAKGQTHTVLRFRLPKDGDLPGKVGRFGREMFTVVATSCLIFLVSLHLLYCNTGLRWSRLPISLIALISPISPISIDYTGSTFVYISLSLLYDCTRP